MTEIKLSARLCAIAAHVPPYGGVADVGTDHGYIPVFLAQNGHPGPLCGTDINEGPLARARQTAAAYGQTDKVNFFRCDGLAALDSQEIETVIIAGMGGETIAQILAAAPWTRENACLLILQPMTKASFLRGWLYENGYAALSEELVEDDGLYELLTARAGQDIPYPPAELLTGRAALIAGDPLFPCQLNKLIAKTQRAVEGLAASTRPEDTMRLKRMRETLFTLLQLKEQEVTMTRVKDIVAYFAARIPPEMKMDFDNVGLLLGINEATVTRVLVTLDITDEVIDEALELGAQLIFSHHPLFFELKRINDADHTGRKIVKLLRNGVSAFCQHTNLDSVPGGVNDALAEKLGVAVAGYLDGPHFTADGGEYGMGRYGSLSSPVEFEDYLCDVKFALNAPGLRYHSAGRPVSKVALCGGSGGNFVEDAVRLGCDTLVTADIKHDRFLAAKELNLNLIDAGHFCTENVVVPVLAEMLKKGFPPLEVIVSKASAPPARFY